MKIYSHSVDAICDLHRKGFINDFQLLGNDLLWIQEGLFVRAGEFAILECHKIPPSINQKYESVVLGITAPYHNIKGILLNHYKSYPNSTPPILVKKLNEMNIQ